MATAAKYPAALLALVDVGGEMGGIVTAVLSGSHSAVVTTITLTATVPTTWPTTGGWVTIDSEIIQYAGVSGSTLTGCTRAAQTAYGGGAAAIHNDQSVVAPYLTPLQWNQAIADLIAVQTFLGATVGAFASDRPNHHGFHYEPWGIAAVGGFVTGSGSNVALATRGLQPTTGTTNPSSAGFRILFEVSGAASLGVIHKVRRVEFQGWIANTFVSANSYMYVTDETTAATPTATPRHFGIKNINGVISFTTADGTTEQTTDVTAYFTAATAATVVITFDGTTAKCFIDGTLRATHSTHVPIAGGGYPVLNVSLDNNSSANSRAMTLYCADVLVANS